jgi:hypothetical protein
VVAAAAAGWAAAVAEEEGAEGSALTLNEHARWDRRP